MTQEDKNLLLKDLCARSFYGVKVHCEWNLFQGRCYRISEDGELVSINIHAKSIHFKRNSGRITEIPFNRIDGTVLPYLRPMLSMTEEEKLHIELTYGFFYHDGILDNVDIFEITGTYDRDGNYDPPCKYREIRHVTIEQILDFIHWLNTHHFDYRGLIPMGFALEAPKDMYNI